VIELIDGLPDGVISIEAVGNVTLEDSRTPSSVSRTSGRSNVSPS
jgi:hypothetical protein